MNSEAVRFWILPVLLLLSILVIILGAIFGAVSLSWDSLVDSHSAHYHIFWQLRVPRVLVAFLAGAGLATAGMVFQVVFLNPLATPYTLGVSSGASFGAALVICLGAIPSWWGQGGTTAGAIFGGGLTVALVLWFGKTKLGHQRHAMLLAGVAISFFFSSLLLLTQYLANFYQSFQIIRWLMGGISVAGYREVIFLFPVVGGCFIWIWSKRHSLDLLLLGDDLAHSRGLEVGRTKTTFIIFVSVMVAVIVSITGPIGFIGMVVPHICRLLLGNRHKITILAAGLTGGTVLVLCDLLARLILAPNEMPVGILTSLIGAPIFFLLLMRNRYRF